MIKLQNVTKRYRNSIAVDDISLSLDENKIFCLLGCNGAGKTTLMKMIAGQINSDSGNIEVNGKFVNAAKMPCDVSFINNRAKQFNTKLKNLVNMAGDLDERFDKEFAFRMIKRFHLNKDKKFNQLSFGMQTMVNTLLSFASNRSIVLLDEPLLGLDAVMRNTFYNLLRDSFEIKPRIIIISTHLIDEMTRSAEELIIVDQGKLLLRSTINDVDEKAFSVSGTTKSIVPTLDNLNVLSSKTIGGHTTAYIFDDRYKIPSGTSVNPIGLQEFFINLVGGDYDEE